MVFEAPNKETEGELFGLWTGEGEPVIHLTVGQIERYQLNGQSCSANNTVSLERIKSLLIERYQLEHIGKWRYSGRHLTSLESRQPSVLLDVTIDEQSEGLNLKLEPYLCKGNRANRSEIEILNGEGVFGRVGEINELLQDERRENEVSFEENKGEGTRVLQHSRDNKSISYNRRSLQDEVKMERAYRRETFPNFSATNAEPFKVYMFEEDLEMISRLVLRYPDLETGGQLFGLWNAVGEPVVHIVLGPGKACRRTSVSFYQEVPYLERVGHLLTENFQLCHIGEWHSHHRLRLSQPSQGDSSTIIRNYPRDVCGFLLIIANIVSARHVALSPYLYTRESRIRFDLIGDVVPVAGGSAFRKIGRIKHEIERGEEEFRTRQDEPVPMETDQGQPHRQRTVHHIPPSYSRSTKPQWRY